MNIIISALLRHDCNFQTLNTKYHCDGVFSGPAQNLWFR